MFNVPKAHTTGVEAEFAVHPVPGLDLSLAGSYVNSEFDSTIDNPVLASRTGIRKGNRLPTVPKFQVAATATYGQRFNDNSDWYATASIQHIGSRFTQPGDQEPGAGIFSDAGGNASLFYDPVTGAFGSHDTDIGSLKLRAYNLVNVSAGLKFDSGLEFVALRQQPVRYGPEAVVRPRTRRSRPLGLQCRTAADDRPDGAPELRIGAAAAAAAAAASAASAAGDPDLLGRLGDRSRRGLPRPPPPPPPPPPPAERRLNAADRATSSVTRRSLLIGAGGAAVSPAIAKTYKRGMKDHVAVVGAGVFGAWTAHHLQRARPSRHADRRLRPGAQPRLLGRRIRA